MSSDSAETTTDSLQVQALRELRIAERAYLLAFGWKPDLENSQYWLAPEDLSHRRPRYGFNHAVNRQKMETQTSLRRRGLWPADMPLL